MQAIIRDFEKAALKLVAEAMQSIADMMNQELGNDRVTLTLTDQYYNMKEVIEKDIHLLLLLKPLWKI